jgi:hypothetical protein
MKEFLYPDSANIDTGKDNRLVVGEKYDYKESGYVGECQFVGDESTPECYIWKFVWTIAPFEGMDSNVFTLSEKRGDPCYYSGMWHIYPQNSYIFSRRPFN